MVEIFVNLIGHLFVGKTFGIPDDGNDGRILLDHITNLFKGIKILFKNLIPFSRFLSLLRLLQRLCLPGDHQITQIVHDNHKTLTDIPVVHIVNNGFTGIIQDFIKKGFLLVGQNLHILRVEHHATSDHAVNIEGKRLFRHLLILHDNIGEYRGVLCTGMTVDATGIQFLDGNLLLLPFLVVWIDIKGIGKGHKTVNAHHPELLTHLSDGGFRVLRLQYLADTQLSVSLCLKDPIKDDKRLVIVINTILILRTLSEKHLIINTIEVFYIIHGQLGKLLLGKGILDAVMTEKLLGNGSLLCRGLFFHLFHNILHKIGRITAMLIKADIMQGIPCAPVVTELMVETPGFPNKTVDLTLALTGIAHTDRRSLTNVFHSILGITDLDVMTFGILTSRCTEDEDYRLHLECLQCGPGGMTGIKDVIDDNRNLTFRYRTVNVLYEKEVRHGLAGMLFLPVIKTGETR